jgi:hypothetical protein
MFHYQNVCHGIRIRLEPHWRPRRKWSSSRPRSAPPTTSSTTPFPSKRSSSYQYLMTLAAGSDKMAGRARARVPSERCTSSASTRASFGASLPPHVRCLDPSLFLSCVLLLLPPAQLLPLPSSSCSLPLSVFHSSFPQYILPHGCLPPSLRVSARARGWARCPDARRPVVQRRSDGGSARICSTTSCCPSSQSSDHAGRTRTPPPAARPPARPPARENAHVVQVSPADGPRQSIGWAALFPMSVAQPN